MPLKHTVQIGLSPSLAGGVQLISMHGIGLDEEDAPNERVRPRERRVAETICVAFEMLAFQHAIETSPAFVRKGNQHSMQRSQGSIPSLICYESIQASVRWVRSPRHLR